MKQINYKNIKHITRGRYRKINNINNKSYTRHFRYNFKECKNKKVISMLQEKVKAYAERLISKMLQKL